MYPNNQPQQTPGNNPYSFFLDNPQPTRGPVGPQSMKTRIIIVVVGVIGLIIAGIIVMALLNAGSGDQKQRYIEISQRQTEIIRISSLAEKKAKSLDTRSKAITTRLSITSAQSPINASLKKRGVKDKELSKLLSASVNSKSDAALADAEKNNRYDETYLQILTNELTSYQKQLQAAADGASVKERASLQTAFTATDTLLKKTTPSAKPNAANQAAADSLTTLDDTSEEDLSAEE